MLNFPETLRATWRQKLSLAALTVLLAVSAGCASKHVDENPRIGPPAPKAVEGVPPIPDTTPPSQVAGPPEPLTKPLEKPKVTLVVGARSRADFVFAAQLQKWAEEPQIELHLIVGAATPGWTGEVGLVTAPLSRLALNADRTTAFLCGPELMLPFGAEALLAKGLAAQHIRVSLERNMQCGVGWCGHCQLGPLLLCRDGPVVGYDIAGPLLRVKEL